MDKFFHSVYLVEENCTGCYNCIKRCPTQAIRVQDGKARVRSEYCIDCGECVRSCKQHAKASKRDKLKRDLVGKYEYLVDVYKRQVRRRTPWQTAENMWHRCSACPAPANPH